MALPLSVNTNYVAGKSRVKAADLNDMQAAIVGAKHGSQVLQFDLFSAVVSSGAPTFSTVGSHWVSSGGMPDRIHRAFSLPVGTLITSVRPYVSQAGAIPITWGVEQVSGDAQLSLIVHSDIFDASTGYKSMASAPGGSVVSRTATIGSHYMLWLSSNGQAGDLFTMFEVTCQKV